MKNTNQLRSAWRLRLYAISSATAASLMVAGPVGCESGDGYEPLQAVDDVVETTDTLATDTHSTGGGDGSVIVDPSGVVLPNPADYMFVAEHVFSVDDLIGGYNGVTAAADPTILCTSGCEAAVIQNGAITMYPIDTEFGVDVLDFIGAWTRLRDGIYEEGWAGNIPGTAGEVIGLGVSNVPTVVYRTPRNQGQWCAGLGGNMVKCKTNEFVTMQHVLTCAEAIPYRFFDPVTGLPALPEYEACMELSTALDQDPSTLTEYMFDLDQDNIATGPDYSIILGENIDEWKYIWGNADKRPTDVRINVHIPLPDAWDSADYRVTSAKLAIVHTTSNDPNDKILPEGLENEAPEGRLPRYEVDADGRWLSTVDCYEGDGDFIPAGTVLRNPAFADPTAVTEDLQLGFTNAWYTSLDRDPFAPGLETGPRWRLIAPKFGQALPGVEIPAVDCDPGPLQHGEKRYERGDLVATIIDLLDPQDGADAPIFATSRGWRETNELQSLTTETLTSDGLTLTENFDLQIHVKGDRQTVQIFRAVLYLDYEPIDVQ